MRRVTEGLVVSIGQGGDEIERMIGLDVQLRAIRPQVARHRSRVHRLRPGADWERIQRDRCQGIDLQPRRVATMNSRRNG